MPQLRRLSIAIAASVAASLAGLSGTAASVPSELELCTKAPRELLTSADGRFLFASCDQPSVVKVVDTRTMTVVNQIGGLGGTVVAMTLGPAGDLWVASGSKVSRIAHPRTATEPTASHPTAAAAVGGIDVTDDGVVYLVGTSPNVATADRGVIQALDAASGAELDLVSEPLLEGNPLFDRPTSVLAAADGNVYVGGRRLAVFDGDLELVKAVPTAWETADSSGTNTIGPMVLGSNGRTLYLAANRDLVVYDVDADDPFRESPGYVAERINAEDAFNVPTWMAITPDDRTLQVTNYNSPTRIEIDLALATSSEVPGAGITVIPGLIDNFTNGVAVGENAYYLADDGPFMNGTLLVRVPIAPVVDTVSVRRGSAGATVTMTGRALGDATAHLGSTAARVISSSWGTVTFTVPAVSSFGSRTLTLSTPSGVTSAGAFTLAAAKLASALPKVKGKAKVGKRLTATVGRWTAGTRLRYSWLANGKPIKGASASIKLTRKHLGKRLQLRVTGSKAGYTTAVRTSARTAKVKR